MWMAQQFIGDDERRLKRVIIPWGNLTHHFSVLARKDPPRRRVMGLPEDAREVRVGIDSGGCVSLVVTSKSFPVVPPGEDLPFMYLLFEDLD